MPVTIQRTAWIDDDGTGQTGTPINNAEKQLLYNQIDAALAQLVQASGGVITGAVTYTGPVTLQGSTNFAGPIVSGMYFSPDASFDIGAPGSARPRDLFVSRNAVVGGVLSMGGDVIFNDNLYDIGKAGATRPRDLFTSRDVTAGRDITVVRNLNMTDRLGAILMGGVLFAHNWYDLACDSNTNCFFGQNAGNQTMNPGGGSAALATKVVGIGAECLHANTTGGDNTGLGAWALRLNTIGNHLVAVGTHALKVNTSGSQNTAVGVNCMFDTTTGNDNTGIGYTACQHITSGNSNVGCGENACGNITTGNGNTALGTNALFTAAAQTGNIAIGCNAGYYETGSNKLYIDNNPRANEADARAKSLIYGVMDAVVGNQQLTFNAGTVKVQGSVYPYTTAAFNLGSAGLAWSAIYCTALVTSGAFPLSLPGVGAGAGTVLVCDASGNVLKQSSSRRYKERIEPARVDRETLARVLAVQPCWWDYSGHETGGFGFIAEDLADAGLLANRYGRSPLVNIASETGEPESIRDGALLAIHQLALNDLMARVAQLETRA